MNIFFTDAQLAAYRNFFSGLFFSRIIVHYEIKMKKLSKKNLKYYILDFMISF